MTQRAGLDLAAMLAGGDRRMTGRADEAAALAIADETVREGLLALLDSPDALVRMRAADALEKVSRQDPGLLRGFERRLLDLATSERQQEVRWHLAQMLPRLALDADERGRAVEALCGYLADRSAIVQAWVLDAVAQFAAVDRRFKELADRLVAEGLESRKASVRARARAIRRSQGQTGGAGNG